MNSKIVVILIAVAAGASGCSNNAAAQTPPVPTHMLTADTDVNQLVAGTVSAPPDPSNTGVKVYLKMLDGPFVLTDVYGSAFNPTMYALPAGQDCTLSSPSAALTLDGTNGRLVSTLNSQSGNGLPGLSGARLVIKTGEELCATWTTSNPVNATVVSWSGFKPY